MAVWLLWRSRRERLARALPDVVDLQVSARLLVAVAGAQVIVAALLSPTMFGDAPPGRELIAALPIAAALCAWGLRHAPRVGAVLAAITLAASVCSISAARRRRPLDRADHAGTGGPLERLFPPYASGATWADVVTVVSVAGSRHVVAVEWRRWRRMPTLA